MRDVVCDVVRVVVRVVVPDVVRDVVRVVVCVIFCYNVRAKMARTVRAIFARTDLPLKLQIATSLPLDEWQRSGKLPLLCHSRMAN